MRFRWSDAWILQAIVLAAKEEPAELVAVIGAADAIQHAVPTVAELQGAVHRLAVAGHVEEVEGRFRLGRGVPADVARSIAKAPMNEGGDIASTFLDAEPWTPAQEAQGPDSHAEYPGLTPERVRAAYVAYRR